MQINNLWQSVLSLTEKLGMLGQCGSTPMFLHFNLEQFESSLIQEKKV